MNLPPDKNINEVRLKDIRDYRENCKQVQEDWKLFKRIAYVFLMIVAVILMFGMAYVGQMLGI